MHQLDHARRLPGAAGLQQERGPGLGLLAVLRLQRFQRALAPAAEQRHGARAGRADAGGPDPVSYTHLDRFTFMRCVVGGLAAGLGVAAMHYVGISAMRMPAVFIWNLPMVVLSVFIAVIAASAALWLAFNTQNEFQRVAAAILMAIAVCGMHYTGAAAGTVVCTTPRDFSSMHIGGVMLPYICLLYTSRLRYRGRLFQGPRRRRHPVSLHHHHLDPGRAAGGGLRPDDAGLHRQPRRPCLLYTSRCV